MLLRRGDADRAEKVLERAIQLGASDPDAQLWLERARVFRPMQAKAGARAVAAEVAHATAQPARPPLDSMSDSTTAVHVRPIQGSTPDEGDIEDVPDDEPTRAGPAPPIPAAGTPPPRAKPFVPAPPQPRFPKDVTTAPHAFEPPARMPSSRPPPMRAPSPSASGEIEIRCSSRCPRRRRSPGARARPSRPTNPSRRTGRRPRRRRSSVPAVPGPRRQPDGASPARRSGRAVAGRRLRASDRLIPPPHLGCPTTAYRNWGCQNSTCRR